MLEHWRQKARELRTETHALYLAYKDPQVPWYAKALLAVVVVYAFSPIDLIPYLIPILGYLDDLVLVPAGVAAVLKMVPRAVMDECRQEASEAMAQGGPASRLAAVIIVAIWVLCILFAAVALVRFRSGASS